MATSISGCLLLLFLVIKLSAAVSSEHSALIYRESLPGQHILRLLLSGSSKERFRRWAYVAENNSSHRENPGEHQNETSTPDNRNSAKQKNVTAQTSGGKTHTQTSYVSSTKIMESKADGGKNRTLAVISSTMSEGRKSHLNGSPFLPASARIEPRLDHPRSGETNRREKGLGHTADMEMTMELTGGGDSVEVSWTLDTNDTYVDAFLVTYKMDKRENYDSSHLDTNVRSFLLHSLHHDDHYVICVQALHNGTAVGKVCQDWSEASLKLVVGIMAGVVFLVPCLGVIGIIIYKDRMVRQAIRHPQEPEALALRNPSCYTDQIIDKNDSEPRSTSTQSACGEHNSVLIVDPSWLLKKSTIGAEQSNNHHSKRKSSKHEKTDETQEAANISPEV